MTSRIRRTSAALTAGVVFGILTVSAQQSPGRWDTEKYAKLPQPAEEYTPVQVNDKLYLIGGNAAVLTPGARATHPARVAMRDMQPGSSGPVPPVAWRSRAASPTCFPPRDR